MLDGGWFSGCRALKQCQNTSMITCQWILTFVFFESSCILFPTEGWYGGCVYFEVKGTLNKRIIPKLPNGGSSTCKAPIHSLQPWSHRRSIAAIAMIH
jgi:hypothetical protein